jgi:hypothetical protein
MEQILPLYLKNTNNYFQGPVVTLTFLNCIPICFIIIVYYYKSLIKCFIITLVCLKHDERSEKCFNETNVIIGTVVAVEISDRKDLNTLYKFRNLISVNRIFIKDYKVSVSI